MNKKLFTLSNLMVAILLVVFLISISVVISLNFRPLYYAEIEWLNIPEKSGLSAEEIKQNYDVLINYNSVFYNEDLKFPTLPMSETGKIHFEEVKVIFIVIQMAAIITGILGLIFSVWKIKKNENEFLKLASILSLALPLFVGSVIALNWQATFVTFHKIFFNNDYWIFDYRTDPVITILPDAFFMHAAILIIILIIFGALLYYLLYRHFNNRRNVYDI